MGDIDPSVVADGDGVGRVSQRDARDALSCRRIDDDETRAREARDIEQPARESTAGDIYQSPVAAGRYAAWMDVEELVVQDALVGSVDDEQIFLRPVDRVRARAVG